jgi:Protein of unknown function (DUF3500)
MTELAETLVDSCTSQQRAPLLREWDDEDRTTWFYTPTDHGGLPLGAQRPAQQRLTMRLVAEGLSVPAYNTVAAVIGIENVLDRVEGFTREWGRERGRDPGLYWLRIFGRPGASRGGWRFGGHHVSLNYVIDDGRLVSATPCFIGSDPARSALLGGGELAPLRAVEDAARSLVGGLSEAQLQHALLHPAAPSDIISGNRARMGQTAMPASMIHMNDAKLWGSLLDDPRMRQLAEAIDLNAEAGSGYHEDDHDRLAIRDTPSGLAAADMTPDQRRTLYALVDAYEARAPDGVLSRTPDSLDGVHFGWAGPRTEGDPHYYRIHGPDLLVEYDNTQRGANHAHSVWRRPESDFGFDVLAAHRSNHPH